MNTQQHSKYTWAPFLDLHMGANNFVLCLVLKVQKISLEGLFGYSSEIKQNCQRGRKITCCIFSCTVGFTELQHNWFHDLLCLLVLFPKLMLVSIWSKMENLYPGSIISQEGNVNCRS